MSASTPLPLRVAIIGAGQVADKVHASYYATRSDVQMVAVMDSRLEQAQALAERFAISSAVIEVSNLFAYASTSIGKSYGKPYSAKIA